MPRKLSKAGPGAAAAGPSASGAADPSSPGGGASPASPSPLPLPRILHDELPLPKLVVFDLDYTLWPFWVDTHVTPPIKPAGPGGNTAAVDRTGEHFAFYDDVPRILQTLPLAGVRLAVASRTHAPDLARDMLRLLHVPPLAASDPSLASLAPPPDPAAAPRKRTKREEAATGRPRRAWDLFDGGLEMYPTSKIRHMEALHKRTGVPYAEMLFFDDEARNREVESLGVTMCLVRDGVSWGEVDRGLREWRRRRGVSEGTWRAHPHAQGPAAWQD